MNVKPVIFLCFLYALLLIASEATEPSKDEKQGTSAILNNLNPPPIFLKKYYIDIRNIRKVFVYMKQIKQK